jgi:hypothetical protein
VEFVCGGNGDGVGSGVAVVVVAVAGSNNGGGNDDYDIMGCCEDSYKTRRGVLSTSTNLTATLLQSTSQPNWLWPQVSSKE